MKSPQQPEQHLLFDWQVRDRGGARMVVALLIAGGVIAALAIGFRVITPSVQPVMTRPQQVIVLNPAVPAERALIHQAMDRSFILLPTEERDRTARLPNGVITARFSPSIASYELRPLPVEPSGLSAGPPKLFTLDVSVDPPLPAPNPTVKPAPPTRLEMVVEGEAQSRLQQPPALPAIPLAELAKAKFRIAIGSHGQVLMALPLFAVEDEAVMTQLQSAVSAVRFTPAPGTQVSWGVVSFEWRRASS